MLAIPELHNYLVGSGSITLNNGSRDMKKILYEVTVGCNILVDLLEKTRPLPVYT